MSGGMGDEAIDKQFELNGILRFLLSPLFVLDNFSMARWNVLFFLARKNRAVDDVFHLPSTKTIIVIKFAKSRSNRIN